MLLTIPDGAPTSEFWLQSAIEALLSRGDDVLCDEFFGDAVILQGEAGGFAASRWARSGMVAQVTGKRWTPRRIIRVAPKSLPLPQGPYFLLSGGVLAQAHRLYPDTQDAFCVTFVPDTNNEKPYS